MPIYEYACRSCEHRFESIQKASEVPLRDCPECGEATLRKLLSAPVFRLKGSGWYETDFKTGDKRNVAETRDAGGAGAEGDVAKGGDRAAADKDAGKGGASEAAGSGSGQDKAESKQGANGDAKPAKSAASGKSPAGKTPANPKPSKG